MEELFSLGVLIVIFIANAISISAKQSKKAAAEEQRKAAAAARIKAAQQKMAAESAAAKASPAPEAAPEPLQVITPTVHAHVEPDCEEHDAPTSGSLNFVSTEGKDPCHADELTLVRQPEEAPAPERPGLTLDWSGESLMKAFVMQEVLQRPGTRKRR